MTTSSGRKHASTGAARDQADARASLLVTQDDAAVIRSERPRGKKGGLGESAGRPGKMVTPGPLLKTWRVERLFAWPHHFRRLVIRWEYDVENFFGMVRLGCLQILLRQL
jgi:hypothetical protein